MDNVYYSEYYALERSHWWFTARLKMLEIVLKKHCLPYFKTVKPLKILNIGVATGATSQMLEKYGTVTSVEYDSSCCDFLKEKVGIIAVNASLTDLPFSNESFDIVCAFDVIEHIKDDAKAVSEISRVLHPEGKFFITVPAFRFLWSNHDVVNHHIRRYTLSQVNKLFLTNTLQAEYRSYFNFWLFFPVVIARALLNIFPRKKKNETSGSDFEVLNSSKIINNILYKIFFSESFFLLKGITLPVGVSMLIVGNKQH
jgi:SAM-dependent methyltransferase